MRGMRHARRLHDRASFGGIDAGWIQFPAARPSGSLNGAGRSGKILLAAGRHLEAGRSLRASRDLFCQHGFSSNPSVMYPKITSLLVSISPRTPFGFTSPNPSVVKVTIEK